MKTLVSFISLAVMSAAGQLHYLAPASSGYIYRSDNNGPASLIQLGSHQYHQPAQFAPPLPLNQQLLPVYDDYNPAPLPYHSQEPIEEIDTEEDEGGSDSEEEYLEHDDSAGHGRASESGSGSDYSEEHHAAHGENGRKGYNSKGYHAKGAKGHYGKKYSKGHSSEEEGESDSHSDEEDTHGKHHQSGKHHKGGDHGHKKHHSKGEEITGYHKVYNKDEFKKDHDFYDVADNSGHFKKHGYQKEQHGAKEGAHKQGEKHASGYSKGDSGKAIFKSNGHFDESAVNHAATEENEEKHAHQADYAKKGGSNDEKEYAFADDDDDDEEEDE